MNDSSQNVDPLELAKFDALAADLGTFALLCQRGNRLPWVKTGGESAAWFQ